MWSGFSGVARFFGTQSK